MSGVQVLGTGSALPSRVVTNDDLAHIVDTSDEWIRSRTGIGERRYLSEGESHLQLAVDAARRALAASGVDRCEIGVCLVASFTAPSPSPSCACMLQRELGLSEHAMCFDLNAACAGFVYGVQVAAALLGARQPSLGRYALVVGVDTLSHVMDFSDRSTCVLFGDGAGAVVIDLSDDAPALGAVCGSRGDGDSLYVETADGSQALRMDGRAVFRFSSEVIPACTEQVLAAAGLRLDEVDRFIFHQANQRLIDHAAKRLHLDPERCAGNIERVGNTSAGSVPLLLDELVRTHAIASGDTAVLVGFGSGLTWAGCVVKVDCPRLSTSCGANEREGKA